MRGWSYNVLYVYRRSTSVNDDDDDDDDEVANIKLFHLCESAGKSDIKQSIAIVGWRGVLVVGVGLAI